MKKSRERLTCLFECFSADLGTKNDTLDSFSDIFQRENETSCKFDGKEESFPDIDTAFSSCYQSTDCYAIHDFNCDGKEEFKVCQSEDQMISGKMSASCIYKKQMGGNMRH